MVLGSYVLLSVILVGFARVAAPRVVFPSFVVRPLMLGIMAVLDQKYSYAVACARLGLLVFFPRCVPHVVQALVPCIMAGMGQRDSYAARVGRARV